MKRTIRRYSCRLNEGKWRIVCGLARAYAAQKDRFLLKYGRPRVFRCYWGLGEARDEMVRSGYRSPFVLQARMWKLALKDAFETVEHGLGHCGPGAMRAGLSAVRRLHPGLLYCHLD